MPKCLQPQDVTSPDIRWLPLTSLVFPQEHRQSQTTFPLALFSVADMTVSFPYVCPGDTPGRLHPHDVVCPETSFPPGNSLNLPQEHLQDQMASPHLFLPTSSIAVSFPYAFPTETPRCLHPQDVVCPELRWLEETSVVPPQEHLHIQTTCP